MMVPYLEMRSESYTSQSSDISTKAYRPYDTRRNTSRS